MCPRESVAAWTAHLRTSHPTLVFSASGDGAKSSRDALGVTAVLELLGEWATLKGDDLIVGVIGTTNVSFCLHSLISSSDVVLKVGKSSIVNALSRKLSCPVYKLSNKPTHTPSTTMYPHEVVVKAAGKPVRLIDTPGLYWEYPEDASKGDAAVLKARDILLRSRGRIDHLKDPLPPRTCSHYFTI